MPSAAVIFDAYSALAVHTLCAKTKLRAYTAMAGLLPLCGVVDKSGPDSALDRDAHMSTPTASTT